MSSEEINKIRYKEFKESRIDFENLSDDPIKIFKDWFEMALELDRDNAICFVLSTVSSESIPSSRVVLLKEFNNRGFIFFTNYNSAKSQDIECNHMVAANFFWQKLEKQIRIVGRAEKISQEDSNTYFSTRPRQSQLGAWVSDQSANINLDHSLLDDLKEFEMKFKNIKVGKPSNWGGYRIVPQKIEFWQGKPYRLHDRLMYAKEGGDVWKKSRLSP